MKKNTYNLLRLVLGISLIAFIFYKIGFGKIVTALSNTNYYWLIISFIFLLLSLLLNTVNLKMLFNTSNKKIDLFELFLYFSFARAISMIMPGRLGDFSLIGFLKKYEINIGEGTAIMIVDKIITFSIFIIFGLIGVGYFIGTESLNMFIGFLIIATIVGLLLLTEKSRIFIRKYILRKYAIKFKGFSKKIFSLVKEHRCILLINCLNTVLRIVIIAIYINFIYLALGTKINLIFVILIESIITLIKLIPITPSGLGLKEVAGIYLYGQLGILSSIIAARYIIATIMNYTYSLIIVLIVKRPK